MTAALEITIQGALAPLAPGAVFQDLAAQTVQAPFIVWSEVASNVNNSLLGASNLQNMRVQVDVYAATQAERGTLADAVIAAMTALPSCIQVMAQMVPEPEIRLFRAILDFSIWST